MFPILGVGLVVRMSLERVGFFWSVISGRGYRGVGGQCLTLRV